MTVIVYGKIYRLNGQVADLTTGGKVIIKNQMQGSNAIINVSNGIVKIEFDNLTESYLDKHDSFWFYYMVKDLLDNFILTKEVAMNKCFLFLPEYYTKQDKIKMPFETWFIKDGTIVDEKGFIVLLAHHPKFREGVRDYHMGLFDVTTCPAHFYRAVESFKHLVMEKDDQLTSSEFKEFKKRIGLDNEVKHQELLDDLYKEAKSSRHAVRKPVKNYSEFMYITKIIMLRTANYIEALNQQSTKP